MIIWSKKFLQLFHGVHDFAFLLDRRHDHLAELFHLQNVIFHVNLITRRALPVTAVVQRLVGDQKAVGAAFTFWTGGECS